MFREVALFTTMTLGIFPVLFLIFRKNLSKETYYIAPLVWLTFISSIYELVGTMYFKINSDIWFRAFLLFEFSCICYFFFKIFDGIFKALFVFFGVLFLTVFTYLLTIWNSTRPIQMDGYLTAIETLFVFVFSFLWFKNIFKRLDVDSLKDSPLFYFISGLILYFSGTFFLFIMTKTILDYGLKLQPYWILNIIFVFLFRTLLIIGIWKGQKKLIPYSG